MRRDVTSEAIRRDGDFRGSDAVRRDFQGRDFQGRDIANRSAAELRGGADISRAERIDRFLGGRADARVGTDVHQSARANLRPSWPTRLRGDRDLGRIDRNLDVAFRNSARADGSLRDGSIRGDGSIRADRSFRGDATAGSWLDRNPDRARHWGDWSDDVKNDDNWDGHHHHSHFNDNFWAFRSVFFPWGYGNYWHGGWPWWHWWGTPTWGSCLGWFPGWGWNSPYYYDYGYGGNVVYYNSGVYVNDQLVGTPVEYAESAAALATVEPTDIDRAAGDEWLPLGTFALAVNRSDTDPSRTVQLAVDKQGIVAGTMYDEATDKTFPIQGRVDRQTQRVAFTIGDNPDLVMETGIFNLTQEETPVLVHKGSGQTSTNLLIRLEQPAQAQAQRPQAAPATSRER